jgi:drug/metabolite transporter (DMT)-like permease
MRVAVPVFGAAPVAGGRALFAAFFLLAWVTWVRREKIGLREHWRDHLVVAVVNNVFPFFCFAWAATTLPAGYLAVINGLVPLWAALIAAPVLKEPLGARRIAGFALGIAGVALIVNLGPVALEARTVVAALVGVLGAALWGWAGIIIKQRSGRVPPMSLAAGSIVFAALIMLPLWTQLPPTASWSMEACLALLALGALCSGVAYLPFFTLIRDIGPSRTLTVGLAIPVLGVLWGYIFLNEPITVAMLVGMALVMSALALVLRR